jgi:hypothetical protein
VGTKSGIRDERYRNEYDTGIDDIRLKVAEYDIMMNIGLNLLPMFDI